MRAGRSDPSINGFSSAQQLPEDAWPSEGISTIKRNSFDILARAGKRSRGFDLLARAGKRNRGFDLLARAGKRNRGFDMLARAGKRSGFDMLARAGKRNGFDMLARAGKRSGFDMLARAGKRNGFDMLARAGKRNGFDMLARAGKRNGFSGIGGFKSVRDGTAGSQIGASGLRAVTRGVDDDVVRTSPVEGDHVANGHLHAGIRLVGNLPRNGEVIGVGKRGEREENSRGELHGKSERLL